MKIGKIEVEIRQARKRGYNFEYVFRSKNREYIEYIPIRYMRVLSFLQHRYNNEIFLQ